MMPAVAIVQPLAGFDYGSLEPAQAEIARASASAIRDIYKKSVPAIGRHLLAAKEAMPHGSFSIWAEKELGISERSARNYMMAAAWLRGKPATLAVLPPATLYALASPGAPDDAVQEVLVDAGAGRPLDPSAILARLSSAKAQHAAERASRRTYPNLTKTEREKLEEKQRRKEARVRDRVEHSERLKRTERFDRLKPVVDCISDALPDYEYHILIQALSDWGDVAYLRTLLEEAVGYRHRQNGGRG